MRYHLWWCVIVNGLIKCATYLQNICRLSWEGSPACHVLQRAIRLESLRQEVQVEVGHGAGGELGGVGQEDLHQRGRPLLLQGAGGGQS